MGLRKLPVLAIIVILAWYSSASFAGFVTPYRFETQNRDLNFLPPTRVHVFDRNGRFHLRPFVYRSAARAGSFAQYDEDTASLYPVHFLIQGEPYTFWGFLPARVHLFGVERPARIFVLGTDAFGRDVFSRLVYGSQISLLSSFAAALLSVVLGLILGGISGYYARGIDSIIMRLSDVFLAMPWLYLLLALRAALPLRMD